MTGRSEARPAGGPGIVMTSPAVRVRLTRAAVGRFMAGRATATTQVAAAGMAVRTGARPMSVAARPGRAAIAMT